jgi:hypothetical protein
MYQQLPPTLDITTCLSCFQARVVVIMEKERCHGCQQRLFVECHNCNNGMDPLIGTIVVASTPEVDDGMSTGMSTRGAKRQR